MAGKRFLRGPLGPLAIACAAVLLILGTAAPALADDPPAPRAVTTPRGGRAALSGTSYNEPVTYANDSARDLHHQARDDLRSVARQFAVQAGVDPNIFEAQINQESGFNPSAYNPSGATGIAQIVPRWHPNVDPTDPIASLQYAANLMASHLANYGGDYRLALAAYNAGPGAVQQYGDVPPYAETQNYVAKILGAAGGSPNFGPEEPVDIIDENGDPVRYDSGTGESVIVARAGEFDPATKIQYGSGSGSGMDTTPRERGARSRVDDPTSPFYRGYGLKSPPWIDAGYPDFASWSSAIGAQDAADIAYRNA